MTVPRLFFRGDGTPNSATATALPESRTTLATRPEGYRADPGLVDAVNVALLLGKPLLLTGEPGTGKTQLAFALAHELGLGAPLRFDTKSTSKSKDLFYTFDAIGRFQASQANGGARSVLDFLTYQCLGKAIIFANTPEGVRDVVRKDFEHPGQRRSLVLIDEVDKAPRDFPNDLLVELEENYFSVPELDNTKIAADEKMRPIVVITSNSEKHLPDAFLRRCAYYDIPFPDGARLREILAARLGAIADPKSAFVTSALDLFSVLRQEASGLRKKPATDELLGWILTLRRLAPDVENPLADKALVKRTLSVIVKTKDDQQTAQSLVDKWLPR